MKKWLNKNYKSIIIFAFLIPIITVAVVSISHVTTWYGISNPLSWSIYLSVGIEIAALSSLAAIAANMGKKVYFPFIVATIIQFIGNVFFSYSYIDAGSAMFKSWVELVSPVIQLTGVDPTDIIAHKRFLAFFAGGMLPIISLSFLHMLVKFTQVKPEDVIPEEVKTKEPELLPYKVIESNLVTKKYVDDIYNNEEPIDEEYLQSQWDYLNERRTNSFGLTPEEENKLYEEEIPSAPFGYQAQKDWKEIERKLKTPEPTPEPYDGIKNAYGLSVDQENELYEKEDYFNKMTEETLSTKVIAEPIIEVIPEPTPIPEVIAEPIIEVIPEPVKTNLIDEEAHDKFVEMATDKNGEYHPENFGTKGHEHPSWFHGHQIGKYCEYCKGIPQEDGTVLRQSDDEVIFPTPTPEPQIQALSDEEVMEMNQIEYERKELPEEQIVEEVNVPIKNIPDGYIEKDGKLVQIIGDNVYEITQPHYDVRGDIDGGTLWENGVARGHLDPRGAPGTEGVAGIAEKPIIVGPVIDKTEDEKKKQ